VEYKEDWNSFYYKATVSDAIYLVKTHLPPRDHQPAIYIVRDGRSATDSYAAYHQSFQPDPKGIATIRQLMLGDDYYGNWSSHYSKWQQRDESSRLLIRFEELVEPRVELVNKIAKFIGHQGKVKPFVNLMNDTHQKNPAFFRQGKITWQQPSHWSEIDEAVFIVLHQEILLSLQYVDIKEIQDANALIDQNYLSFLTLAVQGFDQRNFWLHQAEAKEHVIQQLFKK